jgi:hypothetical protein
LFLGGGIPGVCSPVPVGHRRGVICPGVVAWPVLRLEGNPRQVAIGVDVPYSDVSFL